MLTLLEKQPLLNLLYVFVQHDLLLKYSLSRVRIRVVAPGVYLNLRGFRQLRHSLNLSKRLLFYYARKSPTYLTRMWETLPCSK